MEGIIRNYFVNVCVYVCVASISFSRTAVSGNEYEIDSFPPILTKLRNFLCGQELEFLEHADHIWVFY